MQEQQIPEPYLREPERPFARVAVWRVDRTIRKNRSRSGKQIAFALIASPIYVLGLFFSLLLLITGSMHWLVFTALALIFTAALVVASYFMRKRTLSVSGLYIQQDESLYYALVGSRYSYFGLVPLLLAAACSFLELPFAFVSWETVDLPLYLGLGAIVSGLAALILIIIGNFDQTSRAEVVNEVGVLIHEPWSRVFFIKQVSEISEKAGIFQVRCTVVQAKRDGSYGKEKQKTLRVSQDVIGANQLLAQLGALVLR